MNESLEQRLSPEEALEYYEKLVNEIEEELIKLLDTAGPRDEHKHGALVKLKEFDKRYLEKYFPKNVHDRINIHIHLMLIGEKIKKLENLGFMTPKNENPRVMASGGLETEFIIASFADTGEPLAVKILRNKANSDTEAMFIQEQKVLALLWNAHKDSYPKNLLKLYAVGDKVTATERIMGAENLEKKMTKDDVTLKNISSWITDISHALEYLYAEGFVAHNDLSANNCVLGDDETVRLTDFSLVAESAITLPISVIWGGGKSRYLSPEKCVKFKNESEQPVIDRRSDVFSLAIMAYQFLTKGSDPFGRENLANNGKLNHSSMLLASFAKDIKTNSMYILDQFGMQTPEDEIEEFAQEYKYVELTKKNCPFISDESNLKKINLLILKGMSFDPMERHPSPINFLDEFLSAIQPVSN